MSDLSPSVIFADPAVYVPTAEDSEGDFVVGGSVAPAAPLGVLRVGTGGLLFVDLLASRLQVAFTTANSGAADTERLTVTVTDLDSRPVVGAMVLIGLRSNAALVGPIAAVIGSVVSGVIDGLAGLQAQLLMITGAAGVAEVDVTGTAAATGDGSAVVLSPGPGDATAAQWLF